MKVFELEGSLRTELGKKANKALRRESLIPCELYGSEGNMHFSVKSNIFDKLLFTPDVFVINLNIDGKVCSAIMREVQFHPVSDKALHVDFIQVFEDKTFDIELPVRLNGLPKGIQGGGKLSIGLRKLKVNGLLKDLPNSLDIDVTELDLGKSIQVRELDFANIEIKNSKNAVVAQVKLTRAARAAMQQTQA